MSNHTEEQNRLHAFAGYDEEDFCPECDAELIFEAHGVYCPQCDWSDKR
jgi:Zn finger protein HypA/HybF involved in hydrogenase expression